MWKGVLKKTLGEMLPMVWIMLSMAWLSSDRRIRAGSMTVSLSWYWPNLIVWRCGRRCGMWRCRKELAS